MYRNRVSPEGIQHENSIAPIGSILQRNSGVAQNHPRPRRAVPQKRKIVIVARDPFHQRIDFIESEFLSGRRIASHSARAQSDDSHLSQILRSGHRCKHLSHRPGVRVVGKRLARFAWIEALHAMNSLAIEKQTELARLIVSDAIDAVETALSVKKIAVNAGVNRARNQERDETERETDGAFAEAEAQQQRRAESDQVE